MNVTNEPPEGAYMDQCYGRELSPKETHKLLSSVASRIFSVGWNEVLARVTYFRLETLAPPRSTFIVTVEHGQFRVREEPRERNLSPEEIRKVLNSATYVPSNRPKVYVFDVGWDKNLSQVTYIHLKTVDETTTFLVIPEHGQFRAREETEAYRKWRTIETPLPFK